MAANTKHTLVPKLRFKEFEGEWDGTKLNEVSKVYDGTHQTPKYVDKGIPFYSVEHVTANQFQKTKYISKEVFEKENKRVKLEKGDILMTRIGDIGTSKLIDWDVNASFYVSLALIKCKGINTSYLNQYIRTLFFQNELWSRTIHVAFPKKINLGEIGNCKLNLPSLPEQQKIANFLEAVDNKLNLLQQKKNALALYKKGVMQQLFSGTLRFKKQDGASYPNWETKKLGEVCDFYNGKGHEQCITKEGKFIVVNSKFISSNASVKKFSDKQLFPLKKADLVMVMSDVPNGKALAKCFYIDVDDQYTLNQRICVLREKKSLNSFLYYLINRNKYFLSFDSGVGQTNLKKNEILNCVLQIPDLEEQQKIANFLSGIDVKIAHCSTQLQKTQTFLGFNVLTQQILQLFNYY